VVFHIEAVSGRARLGELTTDHGSLPTPAFMPVGTVGSVKGIESRELAALGADIALANAYHLYLRPGLDILNQMGGLQEFISWKKPMLVDSGGFQVFSLAELRHVNDGGVTFRSHIDGSLHLFTPEKVIEIQRVIGADLIMPLDELVGWPATRDEADKAAERTWLWLQRSMDAFEKSAPLYGHRQILLPIVQGSFYSDLRLREVERLASLHAEAYAIGGLSVGEEGTRTRDAIDLVTPILPADRPRYAMGVGTPADILDAIGRGVDLFDCVIPTRNGRRATLFTFRGRVNMKNQRHASDSAPVEEGCPCPCCSQYSRAYLRHLYISGELLAMKLGTAHNLSFYFRLLQEARRQIEAGDYDQWAAEMIPQVQGLEGGEERVVPGP